MRDKSRGLLLYSGLPVGGVAMGFVLGTYALLGGPPDVPLVLLAGCGTVLVYQLDRILGLSPEDAFNQPERVAWLTRHRRGMRASAAGLAAAALGLASFLHPRTLVVAVLLALFALLYVAPVLPRGRLKSVWYLKPLAIAGAWAAGGVLLPVLEAGRPFTAGVAALVAYRFLFVLPNALMADWPDREGDAAVGLRTAATELGETRLQHLAMASTGLALTGALCAVLLGAAPWLLGVDLLGVLLMGALVRKSRPRSRFFYGFLMDLVVAWPGMTALVGWASGVWQV